jgi:hypothetical protein
MERWKLLEEGKKPVKCPICEQVVPCVSKFITFYCLAMHIAAKWDDEAHVQWRKSHGITPNVYQSVGQVQTMLKQIMAALPEPDMSTVFPSST